MAGLEGREALRLAVTLETANAAAKGSHFDEHVFVQPCSVAGTAIQDFDLTVQPCSAAAAAGNAMQDWIGLSVQASGNARYDWTHLTVPPCSAAGGNAMHDWIGLAVVVGKNLLEDEGLQQEGKRLV